MMAAWLLLSLSAVGEMSPGEAILSRSDFPWYGQADDELDEPEPDRDEDRPRRERRPDVDPDLEIDADLDLPSISIPPALVWTLLIVLGAVVLAIVAYQIYKSYRGGKRADRQKKPVSPIIVGQSADSLPEEWQHIEPWEQHLRQAREAIQAGRLIDAARQLYWASISLLRDRGLVMLADGMSNRDVIRQIRQNQGKIDPFRDVFMVFEHAHFGQIEPGSMRVSALVDDVERRGHDS